MTEPWSPRSWQRKPVAQRVTYPDCTALERVLEETRCPGYRHHGWGYPFDWVTRNGTIAAGTPLITTTPYAYEAFELVHQKAEGAIKALLEF